MSGPIESEKRDAVKYVHGLLNLRKSRRRVKLTPEGLVALLDQKTDAALISQNPAKENGIFAPLGRIDQAIINTLLTMGDRIPDIASLQSIVFDSVHPLVEKIDYYLNGLPNMQINPYINIFSTHASEINDTNVQKKYASLTSASPRKTYSHKDLHHALLRGALFRLYGFKLDWNNRLTANPYLHYQKELNGPCKRVDSSTDVYESPETANLWVVRVEERNLSTTPPKPSLIWEVLLIQREEALIQNLGLAKLT